MSTDFWTGVAVGAGLVFLLMVGMGAILSGSWLRHHEESELEPAPRHRKGTPR